MIPKAFKGYELATCEIYGSRFYCLVTGTNRVKTVEELFFQRDYVGDGFVKVVVKGEAALKKLLKKVSKGSYISFAAGPHYPEKLHKELMEYGKGLGLKIH